MAAFPPVYVINLDRSEERLENIRSQLKSQDIEPIRVQAVDAQDLDPLALKEVFDTQRASRSYFVPMHAGEIACFLSHARAWKTFLEGSTESLCVILEDDAYVSDDFQTLLRDIASTEAGDWDMIKLYFKKKYAAKELTTLPGGRRLIRFMRQPTGTVGQIVSRRGAEKLLSRLLPIFRPIDVQLQHWWEFGLDILAVDPPPVREVSPSLQGTTLGSSRSPDLPARIEREWKRFGFRLTLSAKSLYHSLVRGRSSQ